MAVYSQITKNELINFLKQYEIGELIKFDGILEGIENTNYKLLTSKKKYILTIFEKRVSSNDLPFFINLKNHLYKKKFICPQAIKSKTGKYIKSFNGKPCVIISYLEGSKIETIKEKHCRQVGEILALFHKETLDFSMKRENSMSYNQWNNLFIKCSGLSNKKYEKIILIIEKELVFIKKNWPKNLPDGIIHGDAFRDNVFFQNDKFSGLIDFYFSCNDFLSYDIALTINAWCFDANFNFIEKNFISFLKGYENLRILNNIEKKELSVLLRGAALRILLTRLHDKLFHTEGSFVEPKDPKEYLSILQFHQKNNLGALL